MSYSDISDTYAPPPPEAAAVTLTHGLDYQLLESVQFLIAFRPDVRTRESRCENQRDAGSQ
jgi:hypothetical protein